LNEYKRLLENIDIVSGSSIGALIACCLIVPDYKNNYKYTIDEIIDKFNFLMNKIFKISIYNYFITLNGLINSKYDDKLVNDFLYDIFGDIKVKYLLKKIIIPCYDINNNKLIIFNTFEHGDILIRDILRGTIAAQTYFKPHEVIINNISMKLIDGGIDDNNTSRICLMKYLNNFNNIKIINLGSGFIKPININNYGIINWSYNIINTLMNGEMNEDINECKEILGNKYLYIDILIDKKYYSIDDYININYYINQTNEQINIDIINKYINWYNKY
jgi:patatin-like phospholipase/acyl hydrolase